MNFLKRVRRKIKYEVNKRILNPVRLSGKQKVFCIGLNKTGTTSLEKEMKELGFLAGNQMRGTRLIKEYGQRNFQPVIKLAKTAQFFQDAPFSYPFTFIAMDQFFPNSKFVLTVRDSPDQWYNSLVNFHSKIWAEGKRPPTAKELKEAPGPWAGIRYETRKTLTEVSDNDMYNKEILVDYYLTHNKNVKEYFRHRPDDLLIV